MAYQLPIVSVLMFAATVLMLVSAAVAAGHRAVPGATPFGVFMGCAALWAGTYGAQLTVTTLRGQLFWDAVQYPAGLFTCITFGVFVMYYTGRDHRLTPARLAVASVLPVATSVLVWVPGYERLVRRDATLATVNEFVVADITHGPLFNLAVGYSYLVVVLSLGLLGLTTLRTRQLYQKQTALITVTALVPLLGGAVAYLLELTVVDYTPVGLAVFGVGVAVALSRYQLLDVSPVPRNRVIDRIEAGIVVTDGRGRVVDINPAAADVVGSDDSIGRRLASFGGIAAEMASLSAGTTAEFSRDDEVYECHKATLAADGGFGDTRLYILTDVTERRRRQEALEAKNDRLDSFAEVLSHDLRNPLSVAKGSAELARAEADPEHFDRVDRAHDRMAEIIDDMLTLARSGDPVDDPDVVDLETVATDAWATVATEEAELTVERTARLSADPQRLRQLFENLFRNAVEHGSTEAASSVGVRVGPTEAGFFVADDGPGIPPAERESVFRSGVSSAAGGTGVGLAIVETVVEGHDWTVSVSESAAGGARFDIET